MHRIHDLVQFQGLGVLYNVCILGCDNMRRCVNSVLQPVNKLNRQGIGGIRRKIVLAKIRFLFLGDL